MVQGKGDVQASDIRSARNARSEVGLKQRLESLSRPEVTTTQKVGMKRTITNPEVKSVPGNAPFHGSPAIRFSSSPPAPTRFYSPRHRSVEQS